MKTIGRKFLELRRLTLGKLLKYTGLTTSLFIFQACYGTPNDLPQDQLRGNVRSSLTDSLIEGIQVMLIDPGTQDTHSVMTDEYGSFTFPGYGNFDSSLIINAQDIDGEQNGSYRETQIILNPKESFVSVEMGPAEEPGK